MSDGQEIPQHRRAQTVIQIPFKEAARLREILIAVLRHVEEDAPDALLRYKKELEVCVDKLPATYDFAALQETGEPGSVLNDNGSLQLLPCAADVCQECAVDHDPAEPHNAESLYYQYKFHATHNRWPTWKDAIAHTSPEKQEMWEKALKDAGHWSEPEADAT